jgi:hypothetical protein
MIKIHRVGIEKCGRIDGLMQPLGRQRTYRYRGWMCNAFELFVMQSRITTVIHTYLKTPVFISYYCRCSFFYSFILCLVSYLNFLTWLYSVTCFYEGCIQSNQQLALSRLMHSINCSSAVFPYQALEMRPAQETLTGCAGLHNMN